MAQPTDTTTNPATDPTPDRTPDPQRSDRRAETSGAAAPHVTICPRYHRAIELIGKRWTGAIVRALLSGADRFGEIAVAIPEMSDRMLSERLKELEAEGVVERTVLPESPVRVEYRLTEMGRDLEDAVGAIERWAERWIDAEPSGC